jgi:hypothetical protein
MRSAGRWWWGVAGLALLGLATAADAAPREGVRANARAVGQYEKLELTVALAAGYANPFDPREVEVTGRFVTPSGRTILVPGFYAQDYTRSRAADGAEVLAPRGDGGFRVRFASAETGRHEYVVTVKDRGGERTVGRGKFIVRASSHPGFVRRSPTAPTYFQYDSGTSYFAIGENVCWPGRGGTYDYDLWLNKLADAGGNYTRLWLANEWNPVALEKRSQTQGDGDGLGRYDLRAAWRVDYVLDLARRREMRVLLCADSFNTFSAGVFGAWKDSPYNAANGGPCKQPADVFTDPETKRLFQQRLRYLVARWGYDPTVLAWEFWNEVDLVTGYKSEPAAAWHREMADYVRSLDPWQHLLTTSFSDSPGDLAIDGLPQMDFVQTHNYGAHDIAGMVRDVTYRKLMSLGKPNYLGEFGIDWQMNEYPNDPEGLHLHNALWASLVSGSAGTAMTWWWDNYVEPRSLYHHFAPVAAFVRDVDWVGGRYQPRRAPRVTFADGVAPVHTTVKVLTSGESWEDGSALNQPHSYPVRGEGAELVPEVLSRVLHGRLNHPTRHNPMTFEVNYPEAGRFEVEVDGVSGDGGAALTMTLDGKEALSVPFPDIDPKKTDTMQQYARSYGLDVPPGPHTIVVENAGADWFRLFDFLLTHYRTTPNLRAMVIGNDTSRLVWAQNREHTWWNQKLKLTPTPLPCCDLTLDGLLPGDYRVEQWDTYTGKVTADWTAACPQGTLSLKTPPGFTTDLAWKVRRVPSPGSDHPAPPA